MLHRAITQAGLALLLILPLPCAGQAPGSVEARVDALFSTWDRTDSPGCALGVYRDGEILFSRGYGMANLELGSRITPQSVFDIGSTSKQFTAMAIHMLAREGKVSLDEDIRKHLPEVPDYGKAITIRHLLNHTSGIRDYCELLNLAGFLDPDVTTDEDAMRIICRQKALNFMPGEDFLYSNSGYFLLSQIVRRVSGTSLADFARERIFRPLGMRHTLINDDHTRIVPGRASGYAPGAKDGFGIAMSSWEQTGDGAVQTSVEDLLLWDRNFYAGTVGGMDLLAAMQVPGRLKDGTVLDYASGLFLGERRGLRTVRHGGAWAGYRAELLRFPDQRFAVACLSNLETMDPGALAEEVAAIFLEKEMKPVVTSPVVEAAPEVKLPEAGLSGRAGTYRNPRTGALWTLALQEGRLTLAVTGLTFQLVPTSAEAFRSVGGPVAINLRFAPSASGGRASILARVGADPEVRRYDPVMPWSPSAKEQEEFAGAFASDELDTVYTLRVQDGVLNLVHRSVGRIPLRPLQRDQFVLGGRTYTFIRSPQGRVTGFNLGTGRAKAIGFRKAGG